MHESSLDLRSRALSSCQAGTFAQDLPKAETALAEQRVPIRDAEKSQAADYSQEPFVIEQYFTTMRYENDGTGDQDTTVRIRVQSEAGVQQLGELTFGYNSANEQMDIRFVRVHKEDGTVVTAAPDAVKELTASVARDAPVYTDYKEKHITVPALRPGETLEYDIVIHKGTSPCTRRILVPAEFYRWSNRSRRAT